MCLLQRAKKLLDEKVPSPKTLETGLANIAKKDFTKMPSNCQWKQRWKPIITWLPTLITGCIDNCLGSYKGNWFQGKRHFTCLSISNTAHLHLFTFPTMRAPWILLCSHIWDCITKKIQKYCTLFISQRSEGPDVSLNIAQPAITTQILNQGVSPEPKNFTGETTKGKSRNILAQI